MAVAGFRVSIELYGISVGREARIHSQIPSDGTLPLLQAWHLLPIKGNVFHKHAVDIVFGALSSILWNA
jgi:hypothetical protein